MFRRKCQRHDRAGGGRVAPRAVPALLLDHFVGGLASSGNSASKRERGAADARRAMTANTSLSLIGSTGLPATYDDNQTQFDVWTTEVVATLYVYYTPVLVALGVLGNFLSVFVFQTSKLRLQSTSQYLSALALSDSVFLLQLLAPWLSTTQVTSLFHRSGFCQLFVYLTHVSCCASAWFVVAFTVERFVAVLYPLRRNSVCTVARARLAVVTISSISLAVNLPVLRFAAPHEGYCNIDHDYLVDAARFNVLDTVLSFTVPLGLIVVLNAWIMAGVCHVERARRQLVKGERAAAGTPPACPQQRVTRMLLIVSSVFVVLNLPAYTIRVLAYAYGMDTDFRSYIVRFNENENEVGGRWTALQQILVMFFNTNFGINFILYCLSGQNFRRALIQAIPWFRNRARRSAAVRRTTFHPARASSISSLSAGSYVSNCTEATTNYSVSAVTPGARNRPDRFIKRWTFDNSRQRTRSNPSTAVVSTNIEAIEMRSLGI